jgi:peptidoglycan/LPS O-acetylase OafA/YrhL
MNRPSAAQAPQKAENRVIGIDYMRLFAALAVMLYHYGYYFGLADGDFGAKIPSFPFLHFAWMGWVGVEIFFVISGYVITYSAAVSTPYLFARGRIKRIWPGVLICATISALLATFIPHASLSAILASYARTLVLSPKGPWVDGAYWTLVIECIFYAIVFLTLRRRGWDGLKLIAAALTLWSGAFWLAASFSPALEARAGEYLFGLLLLRHGGLFALGMYIYFLQVDFGDRVSWALALLALVSSAHEIFHQAVLAAGIAHGFVALPFLVWAGCILFMMTAAWTRFSTVAGASRSNRIAQRFGRLTYPIYLIHGVIGTVLLPRLPYGVAVWACMALVLTVSTVIISGPEQFIAAKLGRAMDRAGDFIHTKSDFPAASAFK